MSRTTPTATAASGAGWRTWSSGIVSGAGLVALVAGIPMLLASQGDLPALHGLSGLVEHPHTVIEGLRSPLSDRALAVLVVWAAWVAWAYLAVCIAVEVAGRARGRVVARVPGGRRAQAMVAGLVGASLALVPLSRNAHIRLQPTTAAACARPMPVPPPFVLTGAVIDSAASSAMGADIRPAQSVSPADVSTGGEQVYVVEPGDTLWSIAERELGSPLRWPDIAARNHGRPQPDGSSLTDDNWILPGWQLLLPTPVPDSGAPARVEEAPAGPAGAGDAGDRSALPADTAATDPTAIDTAATGNAPVAHAAPTQRNTEAGASRHRVGVRGPLAPVAPVGFGIMAAGVIAVLARLRRIQQRRRPEGLRVSLPEADLTELEAGLRVAADDELLHDVDGALRLLHEEVRRTGVGPPAIVAVRCRPDGLEFVLDGPAKGSSPPAPFSPALDEGSWLLGGRWLRGEGRARLAELSHRDAAMPTLVTVAADDATTLLVDLEQAGSLSLSGSDAAMMLQGIVVELCTLPWADGVDVVVVGQHGDLRSLDRARASASVAALVPEVRRRVASQRALAESNGTMRIPDARWSGDEACWDPLVVVCFGEAAGAEPEAVRHLASLAGDGSAGVAVIVGAAVETARWAVVSDGGPVSFHPHSNVDLEETEPPLASVVGDSQLFPQPAPADLIRRVDALLESAGPDAPLVSDATQDEEVTGPAAKWTEERRGTGPDHAAANGATMDPGRSAEPVAAHQREVRILVLGPVGVVGAERPFSRAWSLDLVVYLALHPHGASTERWSEALWPDRVMAPASLHSTASAARRALGVSSTGDDHLPRSHGRLALGPSVTSDWEECRTLAGSDDLEEWERALRLVRGRPFEGLRSTDWTVLEGMQATIEGTIVDLACRFARRTLDTDPGRAEWAARQALLVAPYDERLYRVLLTAADNSGNPAGVEKAMAELLTVVAEEVEPLDSIHPETLDLYRSLSRRGRTIRGANA